MNEWLSASELAELRLPGLPLGRSSIIRRAQAEGWQARPRQGRGGGYEYHVSSLPAEARAALLAHQLGQSEAGREGATVAAKLKLAEEMERRAHEARRQESMAEVATLSEAEQRRLDARLEILSALERFEQHAGLPKKKLLDHFERLYNARQVDAISPATYRDVERISGRTVQRWQRMLAEEGIAALAGAYGRRSERQYTPVIDAHPAMREMILGMIAESPHVNARHVMRALRARFGASEVPSLRTVQRFMADFQKADPQLAEYLKSPDAWRSKYKVSFGSASEGVTALNQLWEMDSTPGDVLLEGGRHAVIGVIDVYSRRLRLHVVKTSTAAGIASLLRRALLDWGIPQAIKTDNGADYTSKHVRRALAGLAIEQKLCPPFSPEKKPFIERALGTFSHDLVELLQGFIGHSVAERQEIRARQSFADRLMKRGESLEVRMTADEFQQFCDDWCRSVYEHAPHDGLGGKTPFQMVAAWRQPIRRIDDPHALDVLLAPAPGGDGICTVQKKGIRIAKLYYQAAELGDYVGQQVLVLYDEADAGRVYVFGGVTMDFICVAECPEITGISRQELAIEARRFQQKRIKEKKAQLDAYAKAADTSEIWREIVAQRSEEAARLHRLPAPVEPYTTPLLDAAAEAAGARQAMEAPRALPAENTPDVRERIRDLRAEQRRREDPRVQFGYSVDGLWDKDVDRYLFCCRCLRASRLDLLADDDVQFARDYEDRKGFLAQERVFDARREAK